MKAVDGPTEAWRQDRPSGATDLSASALEDASKMDVIGRQEIGEDNLRPSRPGRLANRAASVTDASNLTSTTARLGTPASAFYSDFVTFRDLHLH